MVEGRILVVEDQDISFNHILFSLEDAGIDPDRIDRAEKKDEAMDFIARNVYKVVLLDNNLDGNNMDNRDGVDIGEQIRRSELNALVYVINTSGGDKDRGHNPYASEWLPKLDDRFILTVLLALGYNTSDLPAPVDIDKLFEDLGF